MKVLPEKTVERLSEYRRALIKCLDENQRHIYSHQLAKLLNLTAVQVRRDLMFIGYSSLQRKGYDVKELIGVIAGILDSDKGLNVAVIGFGNLGKAIISYFSGKRSKLNIVAAFDNNDTKIGSAFNNIQCFAVSEMQQVICSMQISIAILTVPAPVANEMALLLEKNGIKGILNFTSVTLHTSSNVYIEGYDMVSSIEKVAYFVKNKTDRI